MYTHRSTINAELSPQEAKRRAITDSSLGMCAEGYANQAQAHPSAPPNTSEVAQKQFAAQFSLSLLVVKETADLGGRLSNATSNGCPVLQESSWNVRVPDWNHGSRTSPRTGNNSRRLWCKLLWKLALIWRTRPNHLLGTFVLLASLAHLLGPLAHLASLAHLGLLGTFGFSRGSIGLLGTFVLAEHTEVLVQLKELNPSKSS